MIRKIISLFLVFNFFLVLPACYATRSLSENTLTTRVSDSGPFSHSFDNSSSTTSREVSRAVNYTHIFSRRSQRRDGATLHAIITADTDDSNIGASVKIDLKNLEDFVSEIARQTGLSLTGGSISGSDFRACHQLRVLTKVLIGESSI